MLILANSIVKTIFTIANAKFLCQTDKKLPGSCHLPMRRTGEKGSGKKDASISSLLCRLLLMKNWMRYMRQLPVENAAIPQMISRNY